MSTFYRTRTRQELTWAQKKKNSEKQVEKALNWKNFFSFTVNGKFITGHIDNSKKLIIKKRHGH